jgi:hypothetical protein
MTDFDLGEVFDGAVCPINTLTLLSPDDLARHLACLARHLAPGARYVVQVGLVEPEQWQPYAGSHWEASRDGTELKIDWVDEELDVAHGISRQRSRIEVLSGDRGSAGGGPRNDCLDTGDVGQGNCGLAVQRGRNLRRWPQERLAERASDRDRSAAMARARVLRVSSRERRDPSSRPDRTPS